MNRMLGPMGASMNEQQLQLSSAGMHDSLMARKRGKIERHRFAGPPENARAMHIQMLKG